MMRTNAIKSVIRAELSGVTAIHSVHSGRLFFAFMVSLSVALAMAAAPVALGLPQK